METTEFRSDSHRVFHAFTKDELVAALGLCPPGDGYRRFIYMEEPEYSSNSLPREPRIIIAFQKTT